MKIIAPLFRLRAFNVASQGDAGVETAGRIPAEAAPC